MKTVFQHYMDQKDLCETKGRKVKDGFRQICRSLTISQGLEYPKSSAK